MVVLLNVVLGRAARRYGRGSTLDDNAESTYCRQSVDMLCRESSGVRCAMWSSTDFWQCLPQWRCTATCDSLVTGTRPLCVVLTTGPDCTLHRRYHALPRLGKGRRALPAVAGPVEGSCQPNT
jgi:hypothetical protein